MDIPSVLKDELKNAKILIVDDELLSVQMLELLMRKAGYSEIISTTDPTQAASLYSRHYPDLVLLDLNMPEMDGFEVLKALSRMERRSYLPVMVLTAETDDETRLKALDLGARDFLAKPYSHVEALLRIKNMLEVRLLHQQLRDQNRNLEDKVQQRTQALRETQLEIVQRLGLAAEYRDNETGQHIVRMSLYSAALARAHGLSEADCELILNAAPMHDVGKIGISDTILLKPGKLTVEEFEIMKTHTTIGAKVLDGQRSNLVETARVIALTHHERWDGTGYPQGLSGEDIPLFGRIVSICDVFDALTSERPYKKAWLVEEAMAELVKQKGKQFDPELVPLFEKILPEILAIKAQHVDE
jgi:putative two-component system response regulator